MLMACAQKAYFVFRATEELLRHKAQLVIHLNITADCILKLGTSTFKQHCEERRKNQLREIELKRC